MLRLIKTALDHGAHVNAVGPEGSALHIAVSYGHVHAVRLLCERGADVHYKYHQDNCLVATVLLGHAQTASILIKHGAVVDDRQTGDELSHVTRAVMLSDVDLLAVLLKAAPTLDDTLQSVCFYTLCRQVDDDAAAAKMAKLLLPHCSSITSADTGVGVRVLMLALANVMWGQTLCTHGGCDVHSKCSAGNHAVHWAARSGSLSVMKWLQSQALNPRQLSLTAAALGL
jgi:ankyrin repeat protein